MRPSAGKPGTKILFPTPHVWPHLPLTVDREEQLRRHPRSVAPHAGLELRLGFELTPAADLLDDDPGRYALDGTDAVLMEVPFTGPVDVLLALAEQTEEAGLRPVIAHPERAEGVMADPAVAVELAERGWLLQLNATSLLGDHGEYAEQLAWQLIEEGTAAIVASDGHRATRPAHLDRAFEAVRRRVGEAAAMPLFDGSALGLAPATAAARAASR